MSKKRELDYVIKLGLGSDVKGIALIAFLLFLAYVWVSA